MLDYTEALKMMLVTVFSINAHPGHGEMDNLLCVFIQLRYIYGTILEHGLSFHFFPFLKYYLYKRNAQEK